MSPRIARLAVTPALVAALALTACSGSAPTAPGPEPTPSAPLPTSDSTPSASSTPARPDPKPIFTRRSAEQLRGALLRSRDLPSGYAKTEQTDDSTVALSSTDEDCRPLITLLQAEQPERAQAQASVSYASGETGGLDESLVSMGTTGRAAELIEEVDAATRDCDQVSLTVAGAEPAAVQVSRVTDGDEVGDASVTVRLEATAGALAGLEIIQVYAARRDVALGLNIVGVSVPAAERIAADAIERADDQLGLADR